jgi:hypothetical protein
VTYLLTPAAGFWNRIYFLLVTLWTVAVWAFFGGAITRMAVVQVARNEKIGLGEAFRFVWARKGSYLFASVFPLLIVGAIVGLLWLFGIGNWIPIFAELWNGLLWPLVLLAGVAMAVVLVGLVGWPMIHATLSAEGSDSFDALSRSYSYVYQNPWNYVGYCAVSLAYGAIVVFFVGFMGSLMVYLGKWAVTQTPLTHYFNRDPSYMFVAAPTSFGWRELLLQGATLSPEMHWWNWIGRSLITFWLCLAFLLVVGFGYSYFWSASSIIYLLMRRRVDDTELDEVYLEEEEIEDTYTTSTTTPGATVPAAGAGAPSLTMVESPSLRPTSTATVAAPRTDMTAGEVGASSSQATAAPPHVAEGSKPSDSGNGPSAPEKP